MDWRAIGLAAGVAAAALAPQASADVVTFDDIPIADLPVFYLVPGGFSTDGYQFSYVPKQAQDGFIRSSASVGPGCPFCTRDGTFAYYSSFPGTTTITDGGQPFSISAFDAAQVIPEQGTPLDFWLTGIGVGDIVVGEHFSTVPGAADQFQTFYVTNPYFDDVVSVTFTGTGNYPEVNFALDNIVLGGPPVPEPATWAVLVMGLGMVGIAVRRREAFRVGRGQPSR